MRLKNKAVICVLALASTAVYCFSEDDDDVTGPAPAFVSCNVNAPAPPDDARLIRIRNFAFAPAQLSIPRGTTVWWINCEDAGATNAHTSTSDTGVWNSPLLQPNGAGTYSRRFDNAGSFPYHCTPHPIMMATITVT